MINASLKIMNVVIILSDWINCIFRRYGGTFGLGDVFQKLETRILGTFVSTICTVTFA